MDLQVYTRIDGHPELAMFQIEGEPEQARQVAIYYLKAQQLTHGPVLAVIPGGLS